MEKTNGNIFIEILIVEKNQKFELPELLVNYNIIRREYDIPEWAKSRIKVNFSKKDAVIMYIDPKKKQMAIDNLYETIEQVTGISKEQIIGNRRKGKITFARQLFHYFYIKTKLGNTRQAAEETKQRSNNHSTVLHSIKVVRNDTSVKGWRQDWESEVSELLTLNEKISTFEK